jgi:hypothetical protein
MMRGLYALDENRKPVKCETVYEWAEAMQGDAAEHVARRQVGFDTVGNIQLSTVFLGLDHGFGFGPLRVFETAAFDLAGGVNVIDRYATWEEAEAGHAAALAVLKAEASSK